MFCFTLKSQVFSHVGIHISPNHLLTSWHEHDCFPSDPFPFTTWSYLKSWPEAHSDSSSNIFEAHLWYSSPGDYWFGVQCIYCLKNILPKCGFWFHGVLFIFLYTSQHCSVVSANESSMVIHATGTQNILFYLFCLINIVCYSYELYIHVKFIITSCRAASFVNHWPQWNIIFIPHLRFMVLCCSNSKKTFIFGWWIYLNSLLD